MSERPSAVEHSAQVRATRRTFVRGALWAGLLAGSVGALAGVARYLWPAGRRSPDAVLVPLAQQPGPGDPPRYVEDGRFWLVAIAPGEGVPARWMRVSATVAPAVEGGVLALTGRCTHLGCEAPWRPAWEFEGIRGWFFCPCHRGTFNRAGINVFGPPLRPMDTLRTVRHADGSITVYPKQVRHGGPENPRRALPP